MSTLSILDYNSLIPLQLTIDKSQNLMYNVYTIKKGENQMKTSNANIVRDDHIRALSDFYTERGEDVKRTASNALAFPVVAPDGEEGWIEIVVKVPKWTEDDDGYSRAEEYADKVKEKAEKAIAKEAERKRKEAEREAKRAEKEKKKKEAEETKTD